MGSAASKGECKITFINFRSMDEKLEDVVVNVEQIAYVIADGDDETDIYFIGGKGVKVDGPLNFVVDRINEALAQKKEK